MAMHDERKAANTLTVVLLEPGKLARVTEIGHDLDALQAAVGGGRIEGVYPFDAEACIVCNEEGKLRGMELNRALYAGPNREMVDIIAGPCFICGSRDGHFCSLTETEQQRYKMMFLYPEQFYRLSRGIMAVPYIPEPEVGR